MQLMAEHRVKLLDEEETKRRFYWPRKCCCGFPSLSSTRFLILVIFGLLLKVLWSDGFFDFILHRYSIKNSSYLIENVEVVNASCSCYGDNFCFKGLDESGTTVNGRRFDCSLYDGLKARNLLDSDAAETKPDFEHLGDWWKPVFVTSMSSGHFSEGRKLAKSIADHYPDSKIVIFDIGLKSDEVEELKEWCNVVYKQFNFDQLPPHVKILKTYAFKLTIIEALEEYKTFFYFDTSIRVTSKFALDFLHGVQSKELLPFSTHTFASHKMLVYLPVPLMITQISEIQSTFQFVSDSPYTRYVMKWWYLCANTKDCVSPNGSVVRCNLGNFYDHKRTYMDCHRFDQAYWNLVALTYLFGEKRGALELGYVDEDWVKLNENLIVQVERARNSQMTKFFNKVTIKREDRMKDKLGLKCKTS
ncbi:hypothetical protein M3Y97_00114700 [Aphelenchoides bicaudatus]|nr:hypothetical protein M3Y97_00114700 [Aphelenchoides bicaudatus]